MMEKSTLSRKRLSLFKNMATVVFLSGFVSCNRDPKPPEAISDALRKATVFPREVSLSIGGDQWGPANTFNPLCPGWQSAWPVKGKGNLMYEPLMTFNSMTGAMEPLLGHSLEKSNESVSVLLDSRAEWSDGTPVTGEDVVFTFDSIGLHLKGAPTGYLRELITGVTLTKVPDPLTDGKTDADKITFTVNKKGRNNPLSVLDQLLSIRIVPRHVIEPMLRDLDNDLSEFQKNKMDDNPVVSGPYTLTYYSSEKIVLKRRDDYWGNGALHGGKKPVPEYIIHPIYKTNGHFTDALCQGQLDISSTYVPRIWRKKRDSVRAWYTKAPYFVPRCIPLLLINCTRSPLSDGNFRRAMAHAINYEQLNQIAIGGYSPPFQPGLILPEGNEKKFFSAEDVRKHGAFFDTVLAKQDLSEAGISSVFDKNGNLIHMKDIRGNILPALRITSPSGWSEWEEMVRNAVKSMRKVGIDIREKFTDPNLYWQSLPKGDFDLIMFKPEPEASPSKPWSRFNAVMSSRNWKPTGQDMDENQGRYRNPAADTLLKKIPVMADESLIVNAYSDLNAIFMRDQPALTLCFLPEQYYEFSTRHWNNFPCAENPYAPPQPPFYGSGINMLWALKKGK